jgi:hypothetical protein
VDVKVCLKEVHELVLNKVNITVAFGNSANAPKNDDTREVHVSGL